MIFFIVASTGELVSLCIRYYSSLASALTNDFFFVASTGELVSLCIRYYPSLASALTNDFFWSPVLKSWLACALANGKFGWRVHWLIGFISECIGYL